MNKIYKYRLDSTRSIEMPLGAEILKVEYQYGFVYFWALVDPSRNMELRYFEKFGTGWEIEVGEMSYIGTIFENGGEYVWHIFEDLRLRTK